ncbi:lamin tail domain-containing protein [Empedobacter brevis]|uniref:lamin tail domain-containing protein n=1 Tax=Empedobacter brevis TaxID=247 RepID=UPI0028AAA4D0|nr:lamin tail domain-containing protein [Empedobacter brevis]
MKRYLFLFCSILSIYTFSQIAITEVYYDTPFSETESKDRTPFVGEYIELFNYTTEDIDIGGWFVTDAKSSFTFPEGTIVKSGDFLLLAYRSRDIHEALDYFDTTWSKAFFPTTVGQENKIIFQNNIVLNNYGENISLYMSSIRGVPLNNPYLVHQVGWKLTSHTGNGNAVDYKYKDYSINFYQTSRFNDGFNFYLKSFQLSSQDQFTTNTYIQNKSELSGSKIRKATPLALDIPYNLIRFEDSPVIKEIWQLYEHFGYDETLFDLLNKVCNATINTITFSIPNDIYLDKKCFSYDMAGNFTGNTSFCLEEIGPIAKSSAQENDYDSEFKVSPNPVYSTTTLYWTDLVKNEISNIIIVSMNGISTTTLAFNSNYNQTTIDLTTYAGGIYVVRFTLKNGQVITKSLIKI